MALSPGDSPTALAGLRIVEYTSRVSASYGSKLLADLGADVIKVEAPRSGDPIRHVGPFLNDEAAPDRGLFFSFLNTNKLGVTLDLHSATGREWFDKLVGTADVLLVGAETAELDAVGLDLPTLRASHPALVVVYVTPFGLTGPMAGYRGGELVAFQMSALGCLTPGGIDAPLDKPPLKPGGYQAQMVAGVTAAVATMHALFARSVSGDGQSADVSEQEAISSFQFMNMARWVYAGDRVNRPRSSPGHRIRCRDGHIVIMFSQDHQWSAWVAVMGDPEWASDERFTTRAARAANAKELVRLIEAWAAAHTTEELYRAGQARRVPIFPLNSVADAVDSAQVQSREFIQPLPLANGDWVTGPSAPYKWSATPWRVRCPAPQLGQHTREVLCGRLGIPETDITAAYESGVV